MENNSDITTLKRKANANRMNALETGMTPSKAFRLALPKSGEEQLKVAVAVLDITEQQLSLAEVQKTIGDDKLLLQLIGPHETRGVVAIDKQIMSGLIEAQTIGYVSDKTTSERSPTKTDGAMCEMFVNFALEAFTIIMQDAPTIAWGTDFAVGSIIQNIRLLGLQLEDNQYAFNKLSVNLDGGKKHGEVIFVFPLEPGISKGNDLSHGALIDISWSDIMQKTVNSSQVQMTAILHRTTISLNQITMLQVGDTIEVPLTAITQIKLEGANEQFITTAKLGQQDGYRAAQISNNLHRDPPLTVPNPDEQLPDTIDFQAKVDSEVQVSITTPDKPTADINIPPNIETSQKNMLNVDPLIELEVG